MTIHTKKRLSPYATRIGMMIAREGATSSEIMKELGYSHSAIYSAIRELKIHNPKGVIKGADNRYRYIRKEGERSS